MGPILAFDSSGPHIAAALADGDSVLGSHFEPMARGQGEALMPALRRVLERVDLAWNDVAAIAVGVGPGNFTGTRISVAAARGLAFGLSCRVVGVSGFESLVDPSNDCARDTHLRLLPAPRGQVYAQRFCGGMSEGQPMLAERDGLDPALPTLEAPEGAAHELAINIAKVARARLAHGEPFEAPAPLYVKPADAAPPRDAPPALVD